LESLIDSQKYAPASTIHGVYRKWVKAGVFEQAWRVLLQYYTDFNQSVRISRNCYPGKVKFA